MLGRVLIFGDSLSNAGDTVVELRTGGTPKGSPGARLGQHLLNSGRATAVRIDARVGRSAANFYGREDHAGLLAGDRAWRPDTVIIWLGTNDIGLNMATDKTRMIALRDALSAPRMVVIGPPAFPAVARLEKGAPAVYDMLRSVFGQVVDARPLTPSVGRAKDGVHFAPEGAARMAEALLGVVASPGQVTTTRPSGAGLVFGVFAALGLVVYWRWFR